MQSYILWLQGPHRTFVIVCCSSGRRVELNPLLPWLWPPLSLDVLRSFRCRCKILGFMHSLCAVMQSNSLALGIQKMAGPLGSSPRPGDCCDICTTAPWQQWSGVPHGQSTMQQWFQQKRWWLESQESLLQNWHCQPFDDWKIFA